MAAAAAYMASRYLSMNNRPFVLPAFPKNTNGKWYDAFRVEESTVCAIVDRIQEMYDDKRGGNANLVPLADTSAKHNLSMHGVGKVSMRAEKSGRDYGAITLAASEAAQPSAMDASWDTVGGGSSSTAMRCGNRAGEDPGVGTIATTSSPVASENIVAVAGGSGAQGMPPMKRKEGEIEVPPEKRVRNAKGDSDLL